MLAFFVVISMADLFELDGCVSEHIMRLVFHLLVNLFVDINMLTLTREQGRWEGLMKIYTAITYGRTNKQNK